MQIGGVQGAGGAVPGSHSSVTGAEDAVSRNIKRQISEVQRKIQELAQKQDMSLEEKMKKRQEYNQQIADLNMQLRQHEIEVRQEKQQPEENSMEDMLGGKENQNEAQDKDSVSISTEGMEAMISADSSKRQSKVYGRVAKDLEAKMRTLSSEIDMDAKRGVDTSEKADAMADLEERMENAVSKQIGTISKAADEMEEAVKEAGKGKDIEDGKEEKEDTYLYQEDAGKKQKEDATLLQNIDIRL